MAKNLAKKDHKWGIRPDHDREVFTVLRMIRESGKTDKEICEQSGVSPQTLKKWRLGHLNGGTRYPTGIRLRLVAEAAGYMNVWVENGTQDLSNAVRFADEEPAPVKKRRTSSRKPIQLPKRVNGAKPKTKARQASVLAV